MIATEIPSICFIYIFIYIWCISWLPWLWLPILQVTEGTSEWHPHTHSHTSANPLSGLNYQQKDILLKVLKLKNISELYFSKHNKMEFLSSRGSAAACVRWGRRRPVGGINITRQAVGIPLSTKFSAGTTLVPSTSLLSHLVVSLTSLVRQCSHTIVRKARAVHCTHKGPGVSLSWFLSYLDMEVLSRYLSSYHNLYLSSILKIVPLSSVARDLLWQKDQFSSFPHLWSLLWYCFHDNNLGTPITQL